MSAITSSSNAVAAGITGGYGLYNQLGRYVNGESSRVHFVMGNITVFEMDAVVSETTTYQTQASQFPAEYGATITDHVSIAPIEIQLVGAVADNPVQSGETLVDAIAGTTINNIGNKFGALATLASTAGFTSLLAYARPHTQKDGAPKLSRSVQMYNTLRRMMGYTQVKDGTTDEQPILPAVFDVVTARRGKEFCRFPSMILSNMQIQRDTSTGSRQLVFALSLSEVRRAVVDITETDTVQNDKSDGKKHGGEGAEVEDEVQQIMNENVRPVLQRGANLAAPGYDVNLTAPAK